MGRSQRPRSKGSQEIVCRCNNVSREVIEEAIRRGADTMNKVYDRTTAGVGPCGGTCRRKIQPMLEYYLKHGEFPEKLTEDLRGKQKKPS